MMVRSAQRTTPVAPVVNRPAGEVAATAKAKAWPDPIGRPPSIENRHPNELQIDPSYQRSLQSASSQRLINKIANEWNWRMCLPLVVANREDALYIIDGQHRWAAAQLRGDISWLPCWIARYGDVAEEAAMFVAMNRSRRAISKLDDFHAATAGGDEVTLQIRQMIEAAGFTVARAVGVQTYAVGAVTFVSAIARMRRVHGDDPSAEALAMMGRTFPHEVLKAGASMFTALVTAMARGQAPDRGRLERALGRYDQAEWVSFLEGSTNGKTRASRMRDVLMMAYEEERAS